MGVPVVLLDDVGKHASKPNIAMRVPKKQEPPIQPVFRNLAGCPHRALCESFLKDLSGAPFFAGDGR